ncbi:MAG: hypothetical protein OQJ98_01855 [Candidatus Pacebacteria bacterium]|nr:hypothetical protein [Candidatus Paceibacterota bacterium]
MYREILNSFDIYSLPNLDTAVLGALELFKETPPQEFNTASVGARPLVIGSANACAVGKIIFRDTAAIFAEESDYRKKLKIYPDRDSVVIISSSGGKHAVSIAEEFAGSDIPVWILTNNQQAPAARHIDPARVILFPKNREPYTYNTSTYLGMILAGSSEMCPCDLEYFSEVARVLPSDIGEYEAFLMTIPGEYAELRYMFQTKFDELFGGRVTGRVFTTEEVKHAKTVVPYEKELFIHLGEGSELFPEKKERVVVPLSDTLGYAGMLALGYFIIGKIQEAHPPYFIESLVAYTKHASELFGQDISPIVE